MDKLIELFVSFAKVGGLTFGGGMAMLPMLQREIVEKKHWATEEELSDYFAIGQCTPGIIAVNTATFIGQKQKGVIGGIAATLGVVAPSILIIAILAAFLSNFAEIAWVQDAFAGIRVGVCVLVLNALVKMIKKNVKKPSAIVICVAVFAGAFFTELSPVIFVVLAAIAGIILKGFEAKEQNTKDPEVKK